MISNPAAYGFATGLIKPYAMSDLAKLLASLFPATDWTHSRWMVRLPGGQSLCRILRKKKQRITKRTKTEGGRIWNPSWILWKIQRKSSASWTQDRASFSVNFGSIPSWHLEGSKITCLQKKQKRRWKKKETLAEPCEKSPGNQHQNHHPHFVARNQLIPLNRICPTESLLDDGRYQDGLKVGLFHLPCENPGFSIYCHRK